MVQAQREAEEAVQRQVSALTGVRIVRPEVERALQQGSNVARRTLDMVGDYLGRNDVARQLMERAAANPNNIKSVQTFG